MTAEERDLVIDECIRELFRCHHSEIDDPDFKQNTRDAMLGRIVRCGCALLTMRSDAPARPGERIGDYIWPDCKSPDEH